MTGPRGRGILALDQGTTGSAALVFDAAGQVQASADQEFTQHYPEPGWVEHDPLDILHTTVAVGRAALDQTPLEIAAIGIANQRETTILWDAATGAPIHPAVVWQSRASADICEQVCVDLQNDKTNCGECGNICPASQTCDDGECVCSDDDDTACEDGCFDLDS